jgi:serine/threonine-protein kinase
MSSGKRFICVHCGRRYRLKQERVPAEPLCTHCGSVLQADEAISSSHHGGVVGEAPVTSQHDESSGQKDAIKPPGFNTLVQQMSAKMPAKEVELLHDMHHEKIIDTAWIKRNYPAQVGLEVEAVEEVPSTPPLVFGRYQVLHEIGQGAMGIVYKGQKLEGGGKVAIKKLHPERLNDLVVRERFLREVEFLQKLCHPHILPLLDGGEDHGNYFLITPFIAGGSLDNRIREIPPNHSFADVAPLIAITMQVGEALQYAHEHRCVHRDVKPANILLSGDDAYLADFGLAKQMEGNAASLTQGAVGTPCYMAPEIWRKKASPQADLYSLGAILYEILTGQPPYTGNNAEQILVKQLCGQPKPPVPHNSPLPRELNAIVLKALSSEPARRQASARQLVQELKAVLTGMAL